MISLHGTAKNEGVAIAVAARMETSTGISGVHPDLLDEGLKTLRKRLPKEEWPEAVVLCDNLAIGMSMHLPGIATIGIASEIDVPGMEPEVPCVVGVAGLLESVSGGEIVIIDGNRGVVHIDPDPQTLIHYQEIEDDAQNRRRIFIESEHIPARTQRGEVVYVLAIIKDEADVESALDAGADGLVMDFSTSGAHSPEYYAAILRVAAGKPVVVKTPYPDITLLQSVMRFAAPNQVTVLYPASDFKSRLNETADALEIVAAEAFFRDLTAPETGFGAFAREEELEEIGDIGDAAYLLIDLHGIASMSSRFAEIHDIVPAWTSTRPPEHVIFAVNEKLEILGGLVAAGGRCVAVAPEMVAGAKSTIRLME